MSRRLASVSGLTWLTWVRRAAMAAAVVSVLAVLAAATALRLEYRGDPAAAGHSRGHDAVWLGHAWVDGRRTPADLERLRAHLAGTGVHDLYVHTGPLEHDGSLDPALYPGAARMIAAMHRVLPGVRVQAWLGDTVAHGGTAGLHLSDPAVRDRIRASADAALGAGFQGVHLDLEPVADGDAGYLETLDSVHTLTAVRGVPLSVAVPQIDPLPHLHAVSYLPFSHPKWWSQGYFAQVAKRCDQIAVMAYDTSMPTSSLFGGYVAQQTALALEATPQGTQLLIGLPGYHTENMGHHGYAETVAAAIRGARVSLARHDRDRESFGMALYVDFHATESDWTAFRAGWGT
ncbi:glycoside hydrolase family 18 protein [Actinacidiphila bryophytorum]|nr:hypothetical protein [Actinacidiphila bryophytorum]MBM9437797.1 hypothetical protein [Actinacidiphila bryophytorum]MBN6545599.1 hypothetical protein [Actinacidiphila bryophytorum]